MLDELRNLKSVDEQRAWLVKYVVSNNRGANPTRQPLLRRPGDDEERAGRRPGQRSDKTTRGRHDARGLEGRRAERGEDARYLPRLNVQMPFSARDRTTRRSSGDGRAGGERLAAPRDPTLQGSGQMPSWSTTPASPSPRSTRRTAATSSGHRDACRSRATARCGSPACRRVRGLRRTPTAWGASAVKKENFVRWAVTKGLYWEAKLGENPYRLGFTGGTDNHNGAPSDVAENDYVGSHGHEDHFARAGRVREAAEGQAPRAESFSEVCATGALGRRSLDRAADPRAALASCGCGTRTACFPTTCWIEWASARARRPAGQKAPKANLDRIDDPRHEGAMTAEGDPPWAAGTASPPTPAMPPSASPSYVAGLHGGVRQPRSGDLREVPAGLPGPLARVEIRPGWQPGSHAPCRRQVRPSGITICGSPPWPSARPYGWSPKRAARPTGSRAVLPRVLSPSPEEPVRYDRIRWSRRPAITTGYLGR